MNIDKIKMFCVTLKNTEERTSYARNLFHQMGLKVDFFYGVDGSLLNVESFNVYETFVPSKKTWRLRNGVIGCGLSHILLWNVILRLGHNEVLILEDDVEFVDNFRENFTLAYDELPSNWDIFYLENRMWPKEEQKMKITPRISRCHPVGTYGYMIKRKVIEYFVKSTCFSLIDLDITLKENVLPNVNCYVADPTLIKEKSVSDGVMSREGIWKSLTYDWKL